MIMWLKSYTHHGDFETVPQLKGKSLDVDLHSYQEVYEYCSMQLASSKILPKNVMSA